MTSQAPPHTPSHTESRALPHELPHGPPDGLPQGLPGQALVHLALARVNGSIQGLASTLHISKAYASMLVRGDRPVTARLQGALIQCVGGDSLTHDVIRLMIRLEGVLGRSLDTQEIITLAQNHNSQAWLIHDLMQVAERGMQRDVQGAPSAPHPSAPYASTMSSTSPAQATSSASPMPSAEDQSFDVASALSGLTSLADILVEEPDLPPDQRAQFQRGIQSAAERLRHLLTGPFFTGREQMAAEDTTAPRSPTLRPDRYVDRVFLDHGYYFAELEAEADLIVRRARRHGPLGTFSLVARLEHDHGRAVSWVEGAGMAPSSVGLAAAETPDQGSTIELDPSLGQSQLRFRLSQFLVAQEARGLLDRLVTAAEPTNPDQARALRKALVAYTAAAMFMPYEAFLTAAQNHRYDIDWLARHFGCSFDQVCHRLVALRKPGHTGIPFGMLRVSPAGQTITRIALPGLPMPDQRAGCPLWAAYGALQRPGETLTQLAEFPNQNRFLFIGRTAAGPRAHYGQPRRLTSVMLACDWAYADALIYADSHDPGRQASITHVGSSCATCARTACENRVEAHTSSRVS